MTNPDEYLAAFSSYVKENATSVEAIKILLEQPARWNPYALQELLEKMKTTPQEFTVEDLQKAHELRYKKPFVDIISMIKHAANDQAPLKTPAERVNDAVTKTIANKRFTEEQHHAIEKIREYLTDHLAIDMEDFERSPALAEFGGWGRANHIFGHRLNDLLRELNAAIAA